MTFLQKLLSPITRNLSLLPSRTLVNQPHNVAVKQQMKLFQHVTNKLTFNTSLLSRCMASLKSMHNSGPRWRTKKKMGGKMLNGNPQQRGVVLRVIVKKPKKPNSANRKCVRIRLTNGTECTAYIPGEGHNLQEHSIVLVRGGRLQDVPGVKVKCIRGKYDLAHVKK